MQVIAQDAGDHGRLGPGDHAGDDGIVLFASQLRQAARHVIETGHGVGLGDLDAQAAQRFGGFVPQPGDDL